jgi:hypothetical protein
MFLGDSQTSGRAAAGTTLSHVHAFCKVAADNPEVGFPANPYTGLNSNPFRNGDGGRSLAGTRAYYDTRTTGTVNITNLSMLWFQESGNQLGDGGSQDTPAKYKAQIKAWCIAAKANSAAVVIVIETAFSFGREAESGRDWTLYNVALYEAQAELLSENGITIYIIDVDTHVKNLQTLLGGDDAAKAIVWYPSTDTQRAYHYTEVGNALIGIAGMKRLGRNIGALNLAGLDAVSTDHKTAILTVLG